MAVGFKGLPVMHPVGGVRLAVAAAGIKKPGRNDLVLFEFADECEVAATFTRNLFCAAPVVLAKAHMSTHRPRYLLINTGNANAGTGSAGLDAASVSCQSVASVTGCMREEVLPFSTGVIGEQLPVQRLTSAIPDLAGALDAENWAIAASAILTTDTVPKGVSRIVKVADSEVTITGICKGSGMIRPDMATMLAFVATDARIDNPTLNKCLHTAVDKSFNRITVDGDTSTNDACVLMASGTSDVEIATGSGTLDAFQNALDEVFVELAQMIVRDGEGATKFVTLIVNGGKDEDECKQVAYTVAHSPLVKTALFASDPNWGRILAAVGRAGINDLDLGSLAIYLGDVCIVRNGEPDPGYTEARGQKVMAQDEIGIRVELSRGEASATVWTCDFSYDYVKINAEYRT